MQQDEIIQEVRANRGAYAERFGFDIRALCRDAVSLKPRRVEPASGRRHARQA